MRGFAVGGLFVLGACSAFGTDSGGNDAPVAAPDASTSDARTPPSDAAVDPPSSDAGVGDSGAFSCPAGAVQCEDFDHGAFSGTWSAKPTQLVKLVPNDDPVHGGVGKVVIDTKSWSEPLEDALQKDFTLDGRAGTVALDFLVRIDQFPQGQIVEVAKLLADQFLIRVVLAASSNDVVSVDLSPFSRNSNQQLATPMQTGVISDHGWHSIHLEVSTADAPVAVQNKYAARLDTRPMRGGDVPGGEGKSTTQGVRSVVGISYITDFIGPTHYAIDEVVITAQPEP